MNEKTINKIGWIASIMTMIMFSSYIDQIRLNLSGCPGSVLLPITTIFNSSSWVVYALVKEKTDWPILVCNSLGLILGVATAITALFVF